MTFFIGTIVNVKLRLRNAKTFKSFILWIGVEYGKHITKLLNIGVACGFKEENGKIINYGDLFEATQIAKKNFGIKSKALGCKGILYTLISQQIEDAQEVIEDIRGILEAIDFETIQPDKALRVLKVINNIIMRGV